MSFGSRAKLSGRGHCATRREQSSQLEAFDVIDFDSNTVDVEYKAIAIALFVIVKWVLFTTSDVVRKEYGLITDIRLIHVCAQIL